MLTDKERINNLEKALIDLAMKIELIQQTGSGCACGGQNCGPIYKQEKDNFENV